MRQTQTTRTTDEQPTTPRRHTIAVMIGDHVTAGNGWTIDTREPLDTPELTDLDDQDRHAIARMDDEGAAR